MSLLYNRAKRQKIGSTFVYPIQEKLFDRNQFGEDSLT